MSLLRIVIIVFLTVFTLSILTVESHANDGGPVKNRWPTCVDTTIEFATGGQADVRPEIHLPSTYAPPPDTTSHFSTPFLLLDKYRGPPASRQS